MAYIGNRPVSGDNNSFRVLDDIKTYTFSFDGSSSSVVSTSDNTITHIGHRLIQGQRVTYTDGTGSAIGGLTDATVYFVIMNDANSFKLASSASNAAAGTAINLTSVGSGTAHNINVAFDGVNTKFKATFNNGTEADVTRVAQIQISLNNVIQQPQNTATPTSGFGFESDSVIVFASAPASTVTFWGVLFANNFPTFEISDNDVDNFTGNGSTTEFSLSKSPASNENIIVTIDGVVQYPSDSSTTRAYNTVGNALQFSAAPANGSDIQARHIGFAGPDESGGGVTAFYGRTGSVFLNNSDNIVVNDAEVTGNLTVQGSMTTLDTKVTEVDQLEVAANNTTVGVAITQSGSGDILNLYDGSTEVFSVSHNGTVEATGNLTITNSSPKITFTDNNNDSDYRIVVNDGSFKIQDTTNSNAVRFIIKPDGDVGINSTTPTEKLDVIGNIKASGTITGSSFVGGLPITNGADNRVITATSASAIQGEAGLTFDGSTLNNAGSGFKEISVSSSTNNSSTLRLLNNQKNFSVSNVTGGKFAIADGSNQRFIIDGSGNVGVGTNNVSTRFEIEGTAALTNQAQTLLIRDSVADDATGRGGNIGFSAYVDGTMRTLAAIGALKKNDGTGFDGHLALYTRRNGVGPVDEVMRLESGGKVGIGTDSPATKLHLFAETGDCVLTLEADRGNSNTTENDNPYIVFRQDGSTQNSAIGMNPNGITGESNSLVLVNGAGSGGILFKTGSGGNFTSGTSEKMRITPDGEIRIADGGLLTINAAVSGNFAVSEALRIDDNNSTGDRALQIFELHNSGARWFSLNQNLNVTTTGTSYTYTQGNYGGSNMIQMDSGALRIYNDSEVVSAGTSAITPTERIRVRSDGKVLIGSTLGADPYNDRKLTINSTSNTYLSIQSGSSSFSGIVFGHNSGQSTDNFLSYVRHNNSDNSFNIHTNSASIPKVKITSDGNVGIGSDNPAEKLDVAGHIKVDGGSVLESSDSNNNILKITTDSGYLEIGPANSGYSHFYTDRSRFYFNKRIIVDEGIVASYNEDLILSTDQNDERLRIKNNTGNVGIGTTNPAAILHIHDAAPGIRLSDTGNTGDADPYAFAYFDANAANAIIHADKGNDVSDSRVAFAVDNDEKMRIESDGKVGIGTDNPDGNLHVSNGSAGSVSAAGDANELVLESPANVGMSFLTANDSIARIKFADPDANNRGVIAYRHADDAFTFATTADGASSPTERLRITGIGSVGINEDQPKALLHVATDNGQTLPEISASFPLIVTKNSNSGIAIIAKNDAKSILAFGDTDDADRGKIQYVHTSGTDVDSMQFLTAATERLRITSTGLVQVGATHSTGTYAWDPTFKVAVESGNDPSAIHFGESVNGSANPAINFIRRDGSTLWSAYAGQISYDTEKFVFATSANAAPGSHSLGTKMVIKHNGNVGIGTVNPDELLHIFSQTSHSKIVLESDNNSALNGMFWVDEQDSTQTEFYYSHPDNKQFLKVNGNGFEVYSKQTSKVTAKIGHGLGYNDVVVPNGNLGIGTEDASTRLHLLNKSSASPKLITLQGSTPRNNFIGLTGSDNLVLGADEDDEGSASSIRFRVDGNEKARITSGGLVGIGTVTPDRALHVFSAGLVAKLESTTANSLIMFATPTNETAGTIPNIGANDNNLELTTGNLTRLIVNSSGDVQIGTIADPGNTLRYFDVGNFNTGSNAGSIIRLITRESDGTDSASADIVKYKSGGLVINNNEKIGTAGFISFGTADDGGSTTERVRIKSDGKVGISSISSDDNNGTAVVEYESGSTLPANAVGGITVKVADESISNEIKLPRNGHIMVMTGFSDSGGTTYPQPQASGMLYVDVGASKLIRPMYTQGGTGADATSNVGHSLVGKNTHTSTVSECDDDKITIMPGTSSGTIRICNREATTQYVFYLTFL